MDSLWTFPIDPIFLVHPVPGWRLVPSQGKATKKSGELKGMVEPFANFAMSTIFWPVSFQSVTGAIYYIQWIRLDWHGTYAFIEWNRGTLGWSLVLPSCGKVNAVVGSRGKLSFPRWGAPLLQMGSPPTNQPVALIGYALILLTLGTLLQIDPREGRRLDLSMTLIAPFYGKCKGYQVRGDAL